MAAVKPRPQRAEMITREEAECHAWMARLAIGLACTSHYLEPALRRHVRKTLGEFVASDCSSETLKQLIRDEVGR